LPENDGDGDEVDAAPWFVNPVTIAGTVEDMPYEVRSPAGISAAGYGGGPSRGSIVPRTGSSGTGPSLAELVLAKTSARRPIVVDLFPSSAGPGPARSRSCRASSFLERQEKKTHGQRGNLNARHCFVLITQTLLRRGLIKERERERERVTVLKIDLTLPPAAGQVLIGYRSIVRLG
jgi:hypothetical protein